MMTMTKLILPNLMTRVPMTSLDPTTTTPGLRARILAREKINVEEINENDPVGSLGRQ